MRDAGLGGGVAGATATVSLVDGNVLARGITNATGRFSLTPVGGRAGVDVSQSDTVQLTVRRLGYVPWQRRMMWRDLFVGELDITLRALATELSAVVTQAQANEADGGLTVTLDGERLRERLASSIAATLANEPGMAQRYNGAAAAQPVLRGLGGDRVLVLEDGLRTGDLATTAGDHAVTIDPLAVQRIEIVRCPSALLLGGSTIGGVVNVIRAELPRVRPDHVEQQFTTQGESASRSRAVGSLTTLPVGPLTVRLVGSLRRSDDARTPLGTLPYTDLLGHDLGVGTVWSGPRASLGVSGRHYVNYYGVPGTFQGRTIPGAHDGGIYVDLFRTTLRAEGELQLERGPISVVRVDANWNRYYHAEFEQGGITGTEFGQLLGTTRLLLQHTRLGLFEGTIGVSTLFKDLAATGSYTGSRPAVQQGGAVMLVEEMRLRRVRLQGGLRYDRQRITPRDTLSSALLTNVRRRQLDGMSGALAATMTFGAGFEASANVARATRMPTIEELFSNGPHLASYRYEIGNPLLPVERADGVEMALAWQGRALRMRVAGYHNRIADFIDYRPVIDSTTEETVRDHRLRRYDVYTARSLSAALTGVEVQGAWQAVAHWSLDVAGSALHGVRRTDDDPLPAMPPAHLRLATRFDDGRRFAHVTTDLTASQTRVPRAPSVVCDGDGCRALPAEFDPTGGYTLFDAGVGARWGGGGRGAGWRYTLSIDVENLLDRTYYDHLSRAKLVAPQPGRNIKAMLQVGR